MSLRGNTFFSGCMKDRWPISLFWLQLAQNGLKHSWFSRVIRPLHVPHRLFPSQTVLFLFPCIFILCLAKHDWLLKCLLHLSHGYRTPFSVSEHGGTDMQSLHAYSHTCVTSRLHNLLQAGHTYRFAMAPVKVVSPSNVAWRHHTKGLFSWVIAHSHRTWYLDTLSPHTQLLYSLKCSWNWLSKCIPLPPPDWYLSSPIVGTHVGLFSVPVNVFHNLDRLWFSRSPWAMRVQDSLSRLSLERDYASVAPDLKLVPGL